MLLKQVKRAVIIALVTFLVASSIGYFASAYVDINQELTWLFKARGTRPPPPEVVVVAMDETSETALDVGWDLKTWRKYHAKLVAQLQHQGAALVVFDLQFISSQPEDDAGFAQAMRQSGNVLIAECYQKQGRRSEEFSGRDECSESNKAFFGRTLTGNNAQLPSGSAKARAISPNEVLANAALDYAPFFVPNDGENSVIRETWTFSNISHTLPVLAWLYYLDHNGSLKNLLIPEHVFSKWLITLRQQCLFNPETLINLSKGESSLGHFLYGIICGPESRFLDYYGPPKTFRFESYSDIYEGKVNDLRGKVIFVGKANRQFFGGKTDFFLTPFTNTQTGKMAGVEIMATLFANLLEGRSIVMPYPLLFTLPLFGLVIGLCLTVLGGRYGKMASLLFSTAYVGVAVWCFGHKAIWLPIAAPIIVQLPLALLLTTRWERQDAETRERHLALAFAQRVPEWKALLKATIGNISYDKALDKELNKLSATRDVSGLCLSTDIKDYTVIARKYSAHRLMELLQQYYQLLATPVRTRKGIIANVIGDSMMALWIDSPNEQLRYSACIAALEIQLAVTRFNETSSIEPLYTRIGIHEGDMTLGRLVLDNPGNLNPIGDTANTASRIEGANKYLGTQILATATIANNLNDILYRPVGKFYLVGRDEAIELIEIVGMFSELNPARTVFLKEFAIGLNAFSQGFWQEAINTFSNILKYYSHDGPSQFYLGLATTYNVNPPLDWDGVVRLEGK